MKSKLKNIINKSFVIILLLFISTSAYSKDSYDMKFKRITIEDGLSQVSVEAILQDSRGLMWFGTSDGLNKYDGYEMKIYKNKSEDKNTLSANYVDAIVEDIEENLWIGTNNGLNKLNPYTDKITRYTKENSSISHDNIWDIFQDSKGYLWIATQKGLNRYDKETDSFITYFGNEFTSENWITSVIEDSEGFIWASTKNGLIKFNPENEKYTRYLFDENDEYSLSENYVYKVYEDRHGNIWAGTSGGGLNRFDKTNEKFIRYKNNPDNDTSIVSNSIKHISEDSNNNLWIGSTSGLSKYNYEKDEFINYTNKFYDEYSLVNDYVMRIYEDKSGLIWIGTQNGISIFNPNSKFKHIKRNPIKEDTLSSNMVFGVMKDRDNDIWIGTNNGLNKISSATGLITNYFNDENDENSLVHDNIKHILEDSDGYIWIATTNGLSKYDKKNNTFTNFKNDPENVNSLGYDYVRYLYEDSDGLIWIGTRKGLDIYNKDTKQFTHFKVDGLPGSLLDDFITVIYEDSDKNMWLGGGIEGGLVKFDRKTKTFKSYTTVKGTNSISSNVVRSIIEDDEGYLWVGTRYGLNRFDRKSEMFTLYTEEDGLSNNFIYGVLKDENNSLWLSTGKGLSKFDIDKNEFTNFYTTDGLQSDEFNGASFYKHEDGQMFFGGINGLTYFYPNEIKSNIYVPKVNIKDFKVYGDSIDYKSRDEIIIPYNKVFFTVEFILPDYRNSNMNQYAYMLEGLDEDWKFSGSRNIINYSNLKGGEYILKVKGKGSNGGWNENSTKLKIIVETPPWKRWWAYFIYTMLIVMILTFILNYVRILERLVKDRTKELNQKLIENKTLYKKIINYEKFKNDFLINLSHELRTPLNVIISSIQLSDSYYDKGDYDKLINMYSKNSKIIRKNTERQLKVVNNLIDTAKISRGQYHINPIETDIIFLVEEIALSMKGYVESKGLNLIIDPEIEEKNIECDPNEVERIVINLISNAVKFTPEGGTIWVSIYDKNDGIKISIKDNGVGIPKEKQCTVFERFKQVENKISSKTKGSGLGLSLVKMLVELHGGDIKLISEENKGSEFIIDLPIIVNNKNKAEKDIEFQNA